MAAVFAGSGPAHRWLTREPIMNPVAAGGVPAV